jgi:hypothetical protein
MAIIAMLAGLATTTVLWIALGCVLVGAGAVIVVMVDVERDRASGASWRGSSPLPPRARAGGLPRAIARTAPRRDA